MVRLLVDIGLVCLALLTLALPRPVVASPCCLSTSVVGAPRLASWETAAIGLVQSAGHDSGYWDSHSQWSAFPDAYRQQDLRTDLWGLVRLHPRVELAARLPWLVNRRSVPGIPAEVGSGPGDVWVGGRWSPVQVGEFARVPALSVLVSLLAPTGRRFEAAGGVLGTGATGRGVWALGLGLQVERVWWPWFVRAEGGVSLSLPVDRPGTDQRQHYGPATQSALAAGRSLGRKWVLAGQLIHSWEGPYQLDNRTQTASGQRGWTAGASAAWTVGLQWTVHAQLATEAPTHWLGGRNHTERWQASVGVRHAFVQ